MRFLHFVRDPAIWVRSAYLYHRKGAPTDKERWIEWRVFQIYGKSVSYQELLNLVDNETGITIEAVRSYPEIAGTARAAYSSSHLKSRLQVSLEEIADDFDVKVNTICEFMGLDSQSAMEAVQALRIHDIWSRQSDDMPTNVTRYDPDAQNLEQYLQKNPSFNKLYTDSAVQMGFKLSGEASQNNSILSEALVEGILDAREHLLTHPLTAKGQEALRIGPPKTVWMPYALQSFGQGGHLMMYEFIQTILEKLDDSKRRRS